MIPMLEAVPPLVTAYTHASDKICSRPIKVNIKHYSKFGELQHKLDVLEIPYDKFAHAVVGHWYGFCRSKGLSHVPVHIFCGPAAWNKFMSEHIVAVTSSVESTIQWHEHQDITIAMLYIDSLLYGDNEMSRPKVGAKALDTLRQLYHSSGPSLEAIAADIKQRMNGHPNQHTQV